MIRERFNCVFLTSLFLGLISTGCAGPTTPFGSPYEDADFQDPTKPTSHWASQNKYDPVITILPDKQVLHAKAPIEIKVFDPLGVPESYDFYLYYNGRNLTSRFLTRAKFKRTAHNLVYSFPGLRLPAKKKHSLTAYYSRGDSTVGHWKEQSPPTCGFYEIKKLKSTESFEVDDKIKRTIRSVATRHGINESLLAGLIAQESAFYPNAVSYIKAMGLTQVTNIASKDIVNETRDWPVNPLTKKLSASRVKQYIYRNIITPKNDWRLDPDKSISGGAAYLEFLQSYWSSLPNRRVFESALEVNDVNWAKVLLASYNSGAYRVKKAMMNYGSNWLSSPELNEASKYVPRIMSYCHHFANPRNQQDLSKRIASESRAMIDKGGGK